jgi:hypothetical protein
MDHITKHYKHKCEVLAEQVNQLKFQLANTYYQKANAILNEDMTTATTFTPSGVQNQPYTNDQLDRMVRELLMPDNWNNPDYWKGYSSAGEFLGSLLGMYQQTRGTPAQTPQRRRIGG